MRTTLGGERLGSGKKMKVDTRTFDRSTHDLSYVWRSTMSAGTLVPFMKLVALPSDTFDIKLNAEILTLPTLGPEFDNFKVQLDVFTIPWRLYQGQLHNNQLNIGRNMGNVWLPQLRLPATIMDATQMTADGFNNIDIVQINPSCLYAYLGIRGVGQTHIGDANRNRVFNGIAVLGYYDVGKCYYFNKQEENAYVIHTEFTAPTLGVDSINVTNININNGNPFVVEQLPATDVPVLMQELSFINLVVSIPPIDLNTILFEAATGEIVPASEIGTVISISATDIQILYNHVRYGAMRWRGWRFASTLDSIKTAINLRPFPITEIDDMRNAILAHAGGTPFSIMNAGIDLYTLPVQAGGDRYSMQASQEGLLVKCYQSDLLNNWLNTEWITGNNGVNEVSKIDVSSGFLNLDALLIGKKVYEMLNATAIADGTYESWIEVNWDSNKYYMISTPMYSGGLIKELAFQEVISNAETGDSPLGTLAGRGVMGKKHKGGSITIKTNEICYIMGIISLTPRITQCQGNDFDIHHLTMDDPHKPYLDGIGFQDLPTERLAWWDTFRNKVTGEWDMRSVGKQPAWIDYMTNFNKTYGNFAIENDSRWMTLARSYQPEIDPADPDYFRIKDATTYIDPRIYNQIFAQTSLDSQNFWAHVGCDIQVRRKISAKIIPNL